MPFLHLNFLSLFFRFDELSPLLSELNHSPEIIAISESRLTSSTQSIVKIILENYCVEHTPTESSNSGTLLSIRNDISYEFRNDLKIYKPKELESIFIEIIELLKILLLGASINTQHLVFQNSTTPTLKTY